MGYMNKVPPLLQSVTQTDSDLCGEALWKATTLLAIGDKIQSVSKRRENRLYGDIILSVAQSLHKVLESEHRQKRSSG